MLAHPGSCCFPTDHQLTSDPESIEKITAYSPRKGAIVSAIIKNIFMLVQKQLWELPQATPTHVACVRGMMRICIPSIILI